jgi:hypothetical protein
VCPGTWQPSSAPSETVSCLGYCGPAQEVRNTPTRYPTRTKLLRGHRSCFSGYGTQATIPACNRFGLQWALSPAEPRPPSYEDCTLKLGFPTEECVRGLQFRQLHDAANSLSPKSLSMARGFFRGDTNSQAQAVQVVFTIFADPPVIGSRNNNRCNRSEPVHDLLRFFEASHMGQA